MLMRRHAAMPCRHAPHAPCHAADAMPLIRLSATPLPRLMVSPLSLRFTLYYAIDFHATPFDY